MTQENTDEDALEADLGTLTDDDWLAAHVRLGRDNPDLAPELDFIWKPGVAPGDVPANTPVESVPRG